MLTKFLCIFLIVAVVLVESRRSLQLPRSGYGKAPGIGSFFKKFGKEPAHIGKWCPYRDGRGKAPAINPFIDSIGKAPTPVLLAGHGGNRYAKAPEPAHVGKWCPYRDGRGKSPIFLE